MLATGTGTTVREFVVTAFDHAGCRWEDHVRTDPRFERPAEVHALIGDASKAHRMLGWKAQTHADRPRPDHGRRRPRPAVGLIPTPAHYCPER